MEKPVSEACERNREPILAVLKPVLKHSNTVLEIGSGTGQHAVYFAEHMPHLTWIASDRKENHAGITAWMRDANLGNTRGPLLLDVNHADWPEVDVDAVFSANTIHIMAWEEVKKMIAGIGKLLPRDGLLVLYGPFNYNGHYTSESNARFDEWLKARDPKSGIRNFEDVEALANAAGLTFQEDYAMPANNRIICWRKIR